jgi:hypothetical protein
MFQTPSDAKALAADIRLAAQLVAFGLQPKLRPRGSGADPAYQQAVDRYGTEDGFRSMVHAVAAGLGVTVLSCDEYGIALACADPEGPFALRPAHVTSSVEERMVRGLVLTTIAAMLYPNEAELSDTSTAARTVSAADVRQRLADMVAKRAGGADPGTLDADEIGEAWAYLHTASRVRMTARGDFAKGSLGWHVDKAFALLMEQGFVAERQPGIFTAFSRFRKHLEHYGAGAAFEAVRATLSETKG